MCDRTDVHELTKNKINSRTLAQFSTVHMKERNVLWRLAINSLSNDSDSFNGALKSHGPFCTNAKQEAAVLLHTVLWIAAPS